ncbi:serine O-acetyltransferase [Vibrio cyclitrophicus]|uniref:serine O-acetyltransferase n=1 Tax=Vibrio cyclitrophicus TaxID=47951 RepID=UPI000C82AA8F|nr:serine acetyltransferase [Vibrio cyclitrophicus]PMJ45305.1 serine acetyltransferase [Vibrio cyclitrophicus]
MKNAINLYRLSHFFYVKKCAKISKIIDGLSFLIFNSVVPGSAVIGNKSKLAYGGIGVVIHSKAFIGSKVIIGQNVTIGRKLSPQGVPTIGDDVYIGAGARILGDINIGNNVIIGANSVVLKDVPSDSIVAGNPAGIVKKLDRNIYELLENIF